MKHISLVSLVTLFVAAFPAMASAQAPASPEFIDAFLISEKARLMDKLNVDNQTELVRYAIRHQLIDASGDSLT